MTSKNNIFVTYGSVLVLLSLCCAVAHAQDADQPAETRSSAFHADAEIDPIVFAFGGHSLHVGIGYRRLRVDLGAYAIDLPGFLEPNDSFQSSLNGFGLKVQYYLFDEQRGGFIGAQAELAHELIESDQSDAAHRERNLNLGLNIGWRFTLGRFYVTPWLLVNYTVNARDVHLDGKTYEASAFFPFPTVHIGYRFL